MKYHGFYKSFFWVSIGFFITRGVWRYNPKPEPGAVVVCNEYQQLTEEAAHNMEQYFPGEYATIKAAAERNYCYDDDFTILLAIRKAENGAAGMEFGVMHPRAKNTDLDTQAGWAAATVVKNRDRWYDSATNEPFIEYLGARYCPVGAGNDPTGLNKNWVANVAYWYNKLQE